MIQTSLAYLGSFLGNYFFSDYTDTPTSRVTYGDNESYFEKLKEKKLQLPGLIYNLNQLTLPNGPSKPTNFVGDDNSGGTKRITYNAKRAILTCSMNLYCTNAMQSFDLLQKYLGLQHNAVFPVTYWATDMDSIIVECALSNFEDATLPPAGQKSKSQDTTGLIYNIECGFSMPTLFLESEHKKIIRCIKYDKYMTDLESNLYSIVEKEQIAS